MDSKLSAELTQGSLEKQPLILAVDEDEDNILVISYLIKSLSCRLITATRGQHTLAIAQKYLPTLILLEIALPDADGLKIIERLKQDKLTQKIPIIVVTRLSGAREKIASAGCDAYLFKPYLFDDLEALIQPYLKGISQVSCLQYACATQDE